MLLTAIFLLAILVISLAIALPAVTKSIQRDRDLETWHRGLQYRRAIQLYFRKFHAYPPSADALVSTNSIRFLRKKYIDPITGKDDWKPVMFGQNKAPMAMGFFGQPLGGNASTLAGIGPSGGATPTGNAFGGAFSLSGSSSGANPSPGASDNSGGAGTSTPGGPAGASGSSGGFGSSSGSTSGPTGQTFGGAGIVGFSPASEKQSILVYKKKNHYNEWEFTYGPISDMQMMGGGNLGQTATGGIPNSTLNSNVGNATTIPNPAPGPSPTPAQ